MGMVVGCALVQPGVGPFDIGVLLQNPMFTSMVGNLSGAPVARAGTEGQGGEVGGGWRCSRSSLPCCG